MYLVRSMHGSRASTVPEKIKTREGVECGRKKSTSACLFLRGEDEEHLFISGYRNFVSDTTSLQEKRPLVPVGNLFPDRYRPIDTKRACV